MWLSSFLFRLPNIERRPAMDDRMKTQKHKEVEEELNCYSFKEMAKEIGSRIRFMRKGDGLTLLALSEKADLTYDTLQRMERGKNHTFPTLENLLKVSYALNVHLTTLLGGF